MLRTLLLLAVSLGTPVSVVGWGPKFEQVRSGYYHRKETARKTVLRDHEQSEDPYEPASAESFTMNFFQSEGDVQVKEFFQARNQMESSDAILWSASTFGGSNPFDEDDFFGEDCEEECAIPEEFKVRSADDPVDVMAFLGIRRATPLKVETYALREWE